MKPTMNYIAQWISASMITNMLTLDEKVQNDHILAQSQNVFNIDQDPIVHIHYTKYEHNVNDLSIYYDKNMSESDKMHPYLTGLAQNPKWFTCIKPPRYLVTVSRLKTTDPGTSEKTTRLMKARNQRWTDQWTAPRFKTPLQ